RRCSAAKACSSPPCAVRDGCGCSRCRSAGSRCASTPQRRRPATAAGKKARSSAGSGTLSTGTNGKRDRSHRGGPMGRKLILAPVGAALIGAAVATQQRDMSQVEIKTEKVAEGIYMMQGAGGNLGVSVGHDGVVLIDDEFAPLSEKIKAAIAKVSDQPIKI